MVRLCLRLRYPRFRGSQSRCRENNHEVEQSKFIPIVCEFDDDEDPCLPTYLKARIWINFSTPEAVNENWERLVRLLYGKPLHEKPKLGNAPAYIRNETPSPSSPAIAKFRVLRQAILEGKKGTAIYRKAFLDTCIEYADTLRVRERPQVDSLGEQVLEDCGKLKHIRNHFIDWVLLEAEAAPGKDLAETLLSLLERLLELKARPSEINQWSDTWFEAHSVFVYETFLYIIAALLKTNSFQLLHEVFNSHYLLPETIRRGDKHFDRFGAFYGSSGTLQNVLAPEGRRLCSPAAELIKRQAEREDITFGAVMEAELLILLMAFITPGVRWYPQTLHYESYMHAPPFFLRASQHKYFTKLAAITGIQDASALSKFE